MEEQERSEHRVKEENLDQLDSQDLKELEVSLELTENQVHQEHWESG